MRKRDHRVGPGRAKCGDVTREQRDCTKYDRHKSNGEGIEYADAVNPEDQTFESHGVKVVVDPKSLQFLEGTELDFTREGLNEGFKFNNPNVKDECGCGESFNV